MNKEEKLKNFIDNELEYVERDGSTTFSCCDHPNWDQDIWNFRDQIRDSIIKKGYIVNSIVRHGVLDITITKKLNI